MSLSDGNQSIGKPQKRQGNGYGFRYGADDLERSAESTLFQQPKSLLEMSGMSH